MVTSSKGLGPEKDYAGEGQQYIQKQTRTLVRESAPPEQDSNHQRVINIWSWAQHGAQHQDLLTDWPSIAMWLWLWLDLSWYSLRDRKTELSVGSSSDGKGWVPVSFAREAKKRNCGSSTEGIAGRRFCTGVGEERTWAREAAESPLLEAVTRERLLKAQEAAKS
jgi:hypothetical protein